MDIKSLIKTISGLETVSLTKKDGLINDLQINGLTDGSKDRIVEALENELDAMNDRLENDLKKEPELYNEYKIEEKDVKLGLLAKEMENQIQASEDQFDKHIGAVKEVLDKVEEATVRQKIAEA